MFDGRAGFGECEQSGERNSDLWQPVYRYDVHGDPRLSATRISDASDRFPDLDSGERGGKPGLSGAANEGA